MEERLKKLLTLVVEDVVEHGEPVGSQSLVEEHALDVSPATIRNWFTELEKEGYITQPHTSSGRVPTEKGYRLYLEELMKPKPLSKRVRLDLEDAVRVPQEENRRMKAFAKAAADIAHAAVLVGLEDADTFYTGLSQLFAQPEFREWSRVVTLGEVLDRLDDVIQRLRGGPVFAAPTPLIGTDCPFGNACGSVLITLSNGTLIGLLGPIRMDYRQSAAILMIAEELLTGS